MKLIHSADIHLGSKLNGKFPKEISELRKQEVRNSFLKMVEFAKANDVVAVLLSGDVFDEAKRPLQKDKEFFLSVIKNTPSIDFLYLRGNHDIMEEADEIKNLKLFNDEWSYYEYDNVTIAGVEITPSNKTSIYSNLSLNQNGNNIVMLHGDISSDAVKDGISLKKLKDKNIDYLALGHIHSYSTGKIDARGEYAYSGCLEGRGFDETGEKGFILLETNPKITHEFISFSNSVIERKVVDVSGLSDAYDMYVKILKEIEFNKKSIYRIELIGDIEAVYDDLASDVKKYLQNLALFVDVKDLTSKKIDYSAFENDLSIKGEFVRQVRSDKELSEDEKAQVILYGLRALSGREVEE